jgi:hypothetical protein
MINLIAMIITLVFSLLGFAAIPQLFTGYNLLFMYPLCLGILCIIFFNVVTLYYLLLDICYIIINYCETIYFAIVYIFSLGLFYFKTFTLAFKKIFNTQTYSNEIKSRRIKMTDYEFNQWFTGFSDAESNFRIIIYNNIISFKFSIKLHLDDKDVLEFIQYKLNCGNIFCTETTASFELNSLNDIKNKLIPLETFPLNV